MNSDVAGRDANGHTPESDGTLPIDCDPRSDSRPASASLFLRVQYGQALLDNDSAFQDVELCFGSDWISTDDLSTIQFHTSRTGDRRVTWINGSDGGAALRRTPLRIQPAARPPLAFRGSFTSSSPSSPLTVRLLASSSTAQASFSIARLIRLVIVAASTCLLALVAFNLVSQEPPRPASILPISDILASVVSSWETPLYSRNITVVDGILHPQTKEPIQLFPVAFSTHLERELFFLCSRLSFIQDNHSLRDKCKQSTLHLGEVGARLWDVESELSGISPAFFLTATYHVDWILMQMADAGNFDSETIVMPGCRGFLSRLRGCPPNTNRTSIVLANIWLQALTNWEDNHKDILQELSSIRSHLQALSDLDESILPEAANLLTTAFANASDSQQQQPLWLVDLEDSFVHYTTRLIRLRSILDLGVATTAQSLEVSLDYVRDLRAQVAEAGLGGSSPDKHSPDATLRQFPSPQELQDTLASFRRNVMNWMDLSRATRSRDEAGYKRYGNRGRFYPRPSELLLQQEDTARSQSRQESTWGPFSRSWSWAPKIFKVREIPIEEMAAYALKQPILDPSSLRFGFKDGFLWAQPGDDMDEDEEDEEDEEDNDN